jgi:hypothetical protein
VSSAVGSHLPRSASNPTANAVSGGHRRAPAALRAVAEVDHDIDQDGHAQPARAREHRHWTRRRSLSSPMSNSRRTSKPTTKEKNAISLLLTQSRRSSVTLMEPRRTLRSVCHTLSYELNPMLAHPCAAATPANKTPALRIDRGSLRDLPSMCRASLNGERPLTLGCSYNLL